jgi:hypothetical protein
MSRLSSIKEVLITFFGAIEEGSASGAKGFASKDASLGRKLAKKIQKGKDLTHKEAQSAYKLLRKNKNLLEGVGVEFEDIEEPEEEGDPRQVELEAELADLQGYQSNMLEIAEKGDPLEYLLDTFNSMHIGDRQAAEVQFIAFGCQAAATSQGLQVVWTGPSGKGKSAGVDACYHLLPKLYVLKGSITAKSLFGHKDLPDGACIFLDDVRIEDGTELEATIKRSTSAFQEGAYHEFLDGNRELKTMRLPRRLCWSLTYIDVTESGDQFLNRMFVVKTDSSDETDDAVCQHILRQAELGEVALPRTEQVMICKALLLDIKNRPPYRVIIPDITKIVTFTSRRNRRNPSLFKDLVIGLACLRHRQRQREQEESGNWILHAAIEDVREAARIFNSQGEFLGSRLDEAERAAAILLFEAKDRGLTIKDLSEKLRAKFPSDEWNERKTRRLLLGRQEKIDGNGGLMGRLPGLYADDFPQPCGGRPIKVFKLASDVSILDFFQLQVVVKESMESFSPFSPDLPNAHGEMEIDGNRCIEPSFSPFSQEKGRDKGTIGEADMGQSPELRSGEKGILGKKVPATKPIGSEITDIGSMGKNWGKIGEKELIGMGPHPLRHEKTPAQGKEEEISDFKSIEDIPEIKQSTVNSERELVYLVKQAIMRYESEGKPIVAATIAKEVGLSSKLSEVVFRLKAEGYVMTKDIDPLSHNLIWRTFGSDQDISSERV